MSAAANGASAYEGRGAGGKFRRQPFRKSQATPYDRPPTAVRNPISATGWLSKIVDPASKILTASALRLFSSVFRKRLRPPLQQTSPPPLASRQLASEVNRTTDSELRGEIQHKVEYTFQNQSGRECRAMEDVSLDNNSNNQGISDIERILKQKTFTKSEIDRLTALLNSRTIEAPTEDDKKGSDARASKIIYADGNLKESKSTPVPNTGFQIKRYIGSTSSPIVNTKVLEEDIATPAELAKAYMGSRPSKVSTSVLSSRGQANDLPLINSVVFPSQSPSTRRATKSFTRLVAPDNVYMTPRSRGRIYSMARTPHSRVWKSSDVRSDNNYNFQSSQLALERNKLSSSRQTALKRRSSVLEDEIGFVGPIRRIRQKPGLLPSQTLTVPASGSSPIFDPGAVPNYCPQNARNATPGANFMSVSSQSSEVAQKILQQLDKLATSPEEKLSECKSMQQPGKSPFTLTPDMQTRQALRSLEKVDPSKFIDSSLENSKLSDSVQRATANADYKALNSKNQLEENGTKKLNSVSNSNSETKTCSSDRPHANDKWEFQMSAHEDYLDLEDNGHLNGTAFAWARDKATIVNSSLENKPQMAIVVAAKENSLSSEQKTQFSFHLDDKLDRDQAASNGLVISEKKDDVSYSAGSSSMTIQPTVTENVASTLSGKLSLGEQSTTSLFGLEGKVADKFTPFTFPSSAPNANDSRAIQTSVPAPNISVLSNTPITKPDDDKGAQGTGDREGIPSTSSFNGGSTTSALFSSGSYANNGFSNGSLSVQPAVTSSSTPLSKFKNVNDKGNRNPSSSVSPASATSVRNTSTGIISGGVSVFSSSAAPFSASPAISFGPSPSKKDPHVSSNTTGPPSDVEEKAKPVTAVSNVNINPFGGVSSAPFNSAIVISGIGSSLSSSRVDNQGLGSSSISGTAVSSEAPAVGTASATFSPNTLFQFGTSGFSSAPTSGLSGKTAFASPSVMSSYSASAANVFGSSATFGLNSVPSSKEAPAANVFGSSVTFGLNSAPSSKEAPAANIFGSSVTFGLNSAPSSEEAGAVSSTGGSVNTLFGSNWQSNSSPLFGSTTSFSTTSVPAFQLGSSAASSASMPSSSMPGSLFGSTGASAGSIFSFTTASATTSPSPSPFSACQPVFGCSNPVFAPVSAVLPANNGSENNNQMSMEDTMAEDTVQAPTPSTLVFGQPQSTRGSALVFGSPSPLINPPGSGLFQFGSQPSPASANQSPFEASGSFNAGGGSFSVGTGGGDKAGRKIIKVRKGQKRR